MEKITREHHCFALDLTPEQEENGETRRAVEELLEQHKEAGNIQGFHFGWNFDEDITKDYPDAL